MPWGAAVGAVVGGVVNGAMSKDKGGGGGGGQSSSTEPWAMAQPWMLQNIAAGQALQTQYQNQPFSPEQQAAIRNQYGQSDYMRSLVPSLLGQIGQQQVGFDRSNPNARPAAWDWSGLLGNGAPNLNQTSLLSPPQTAATPKQEDKKPEDAKQFTQLDGHWWTPDGAGAQMGSYGTFKFGDPVDPKNAQQMQDLRMYYTLGGRDPFGRYADLMPDIRAPYSAPNLGGN